MEVDSKRIKRTQIIVSGLVAVAFLGMIYLLIFTNDVQVSLSLLILCCFGAAIAAGTLGYRFALHGNRADNTLSSSLHPLEALHKAALDESPYMMHIKDLNGQYVMVNKKARNVFHLPKTQPLTEQESFKDFKDKLSAYKHFDQLVITDKRMHAFEDSFVLEGETIYLYVLKYPILNDKGDVQYICGVSLDISELKKTQLELKKAKVEADEARAMQQQFLAYITHDIRTPMNGVLGLCDLLKSSELTEDQKLYVHYIGDAVNNLLTLVSDILDFSKIKYGSFDIQEVPFSIRDTVTKALYPLESIASDKAIYLKYDIEDAIPATVLGDPMRMQQIILNLVGNAMKFTSSGGVDVHVKTLGRHADCVNIGIDIRDSGIGIPDEQLKAVFDVYKQSDKDTSRIYGGTGLGLAIVEQLVDLHGGSINVTSEVGKGTHFTIMIPYQVQS